MSYPEKVDTLDLIFEILREHEKRLDELIARLEKVTPGPRNDPEREMIGRAFGPVERRDMR